MHPFPHHYQVHARGSSTGPVSLDSEGAPTLPSVPPVQFGGAGDGWSPETLLVAAATSCFVLTFRAVAAASKLSWQRLECEADGLLDRRDTVTRFVALHLRARLLIAPGQDAERATRLLEKAEKTCLVTNSLAFMPTLESEVVVEG